MPCMCGDICCWSCGPAQGNNRCPVCGTWDSDGGCTNPVDCLEKSRELDERYAQEMAEEQRLADEYWAEEARLQEERLAQKSQTCRHGLSPVDCNDCLIEGDQAYDATK